MTDFAQAVANRRAGIPPGAPAPEALSFVYDDGGRDLAGYKGDASDCVVRAIAIATGEDYQWVYDQLNLMAKAERPRKGKKRSSSREGVYRRTYERLLDTLGWEWTPTMGIGTGCQVHLRADELPEGTIITRLSKHLSAVKDGAIRDTGDPSRGGTRCVYGYWKRRT